MATGKFKITSAALVIFLLDRGGLYPSGGLWVPARYKLGSVVAYWLRCCHRFNSPQRKEARGHPMWKAGSGGGSNQNTSPKSSTNGRVEELFPKSPKHRQGQPSPSSLPSRTRAKQVVKPNDPNRSRPQATMESHVHKTHICNFKIFW